MPNLVSFRLMDFGFKPSPCQGDNRLLKVRLGSPKKRILFCTFEAGMCMKTKKTQAFSPSEKQTFVPKPHAWGGQKCICDR